jgi:hypothetical protein
VGLPGTRRAVTCRGQHGRASGRATDATWATAPPERPQVPPCRDLLPHPGPVRRRDVLVLEGGDQHLADPPALHVLDADRQPRELELVAFDGHPAERAEHEAADGVPALLGQVAAEQLVEVVDPQPGVHAQRPVRQRLDQRLLLVVLVDDLPDDLLEDVLDRDQPDEFPVFVDHQGEVDPLGLQVAEQVVAALGLRHVGRARTRSCQPRAAAPSTIRPNRSFA